MWHSFEGKPLEQQGLNIRRLLTSFPGTLLVDLTINEPEMFVWLGTLLLIFSRHFKLFLDFFLFLFLFFSSKIIMLLLKTLWTFHGVSSWNSCLLSPPPPPPLDCSYIPLFPYQVRSFKVFAVIWYYSLRFLVLVIYIKVLAPQYHCLSFFSFYYYFGGFCIFGKDSMYILPSWFYDLFIYVDSPPPFLYTPKMEVWTSTAQ